MNRKINLFIIFVLLVIPTFGFGPPDWAEPYVNSYCPKDSKIISKDDDWVAIYMETEFSITSEGNIIKTKRALLENLSDGEKNFFDLIFFNEEKEQVEQMELKIQSKYRWKTIKVQKKGGVLKSNQGRSMVIVSAEPIPPHHKIAWEYSLIIKSDVAMWEEESANEGYPVLQKKIFITQMAKDKNFHLKCFDNLSSSLQEGFYKLSDDSYIIKDIPSYLHLGVDLESICLECRYPFFIFEKKGKEENTIDFASKYMEKWEKSIKESERAIIEEFAQNLTKGKNTLEEKIRSIADFVQFDVGYDIPPTKGDLGLFPLSPCEVLRARRGDCKGKVFLAQNLLKAIGVNSEIILVKLSSEYYPTKIESISQIIFFNHVVLAVENNNLFNYDAEIVEGPAKGKILFDPTTESASFGESPSGLEGILGFMPKYPEKGFFEIHLKNPAIWSFKCKAEIKYDNLQNINAKLNYIDNGMSYIQDIATLKPTVEENKVELVKLYSDIFNDVKILSYEFKKPPQSKNKEGIISMKIEKPYYLLQKSTLFINPLLIPLQGTTFFETEKQKEKEDYKIVLKPPWDRKLSGSAFYKKIEIEVEVVFENAPLFPLPDNLQLTKPWMDVSIKWAKVEEKKYSAKMVIFMPRGIWQNEKGEERKSDIDKTINIINKPIKGFQPNAN